MHLCELEFNNKILWVKVNNFSVGSDICGCLSLNSKDNDIGDIKECLGLNCQRAILAYQSNHYEVLITGIAWKYPEWRCNFIAIPCQEKNNTMWDIRKQDECTLNDMKELLGDEDLLSLERQALALIEKYRYHRPTSQLNGADAVAAVIAKTWSVAFFSEAELSRNPLLILLVREAHALGFAVETTNIDNAVYLAVGQNIQETMCHQAV